MDINVGDMVYVATYGRRAKEIQCPHCLGTRYCTVTIATGEVFTVDCGTCSRGYEGSTGTITYYDHTPEVKQVRISRIELRQDGKDYYSDCYYFDSKRVFLSKEEAEQEAIILTEQAAREQAESIKTKYKDTKSWAWNASYHKKQIEKCKKDIEYHEKKLNAANLKIKQDKKQ